MRYDRQIIGYHACAQPIAERLLEGEPFRPSTNDWDWLGHGVYFWEYGYQRAQDWATQWPRLQGRPFAVVGAIIQLGHCLDLLDTEHTQRLARFAARHVSSHRPLPENVGAKRSRDCFLINRFCDRTVREGAPYDTVRGLFQEGTPLVEGSALLSQNHIQIVVRNPAAIVGLFRPRVFAAWG